MNRNYCQFQRHGVHCYCRKTILCREKNEMFSGCQFGVSPTDIVTNEYRGTTHFYFKFTSPRQYHSQMPIVLMQLQRDPRNILVITRRRHEESLFEPVFQWKYAMQRLPGSHFYRTFANIDMRDKQNANIMLFMFDILSADPQQVMSHFTKPYNWKFSS